MFDKDFFQKHQRKLLWLLNTPIIKIWFRWVMKIDQKAKVDRIDPNATFWRAEENKVGFDIRTHAKYSKRLYYGFYYIWAIAHFLDMELINSFVPKYNLGFDSFGPIYPDAGTGNTTVDGWTRRQGVNETFSTIRNGAGNGSSDTDTDYTVFVWSSDTTNQFTWMNRLGYTLDLSALSGTVDSVVFSLHDLSGSVTEDLGGTPDVDIVGFSPANNDEIVNADYGQFGATAYSSIALSSINDDGSYNNFTLNATGEGAIETAFGGIVGLGARMSWDTDNSFGGTWASYKQSKCGFFFADQTGTSNDPKLTGTFTPAATDTGFFNIL